MIPAWLAAEVAGYKVPVAKPPDLVLDIGANVGAFTDYALKQWPECHVFAFEPNPDAIAQFEENITSDRAILIPRAVSKEASTAKFRKGDNIATGSLHDIGRQTGEEISVETVAARDLPAADFIKIDTEGAEVEILQGLDLSKCNTLVVEWHRPQDYDQVKWIARDAGLLLHESIETAPGCGVLKFTRHTISGRLFVGIPSYGGMCSYFARCMLNLQSGRDMDLLVRFRIGDSLVNRSRNEITDEFLGTNCESLLFIDSDIIFSPQQVQRIASHDELVVGGCYPKKQPKLAWVLNTLPGEDTPRADGLHKVRYVGTGFMHVRRPVFAQMIERWGPEIIYKPDHAQNRRAYDFWSVGVYPGTQRFLSEDWYFCQRALDLGIPVWADTRVKLKHVGEAVYPME